MQAIAREPTDRYASMDEMTGAIGTSMKNANRGSVAAPVAQLVPVATAALPTAQAVAAPDSGSNATTAEDPPRRPIRWRVVGPAGGGGVLLVTLVLVLVLNGSKEKPPVAP